MSAAPVTTILTLRLDPASQDRFDTLRRKHFPPERNLIPAHITLFHALPADAWIGAALDELARSTPAFPVRVTGLRPLGRGVAYTLASTELLALQRSLATRFAEELIPQDRQPFRPHVVVQNKVTPEAARALLSTLEQAFQPWTVTALGLDLWHYLGGPWDHAATFPFANPTT